MWLIRAIVLMVLAGAHPAAGQDQISPDAFLDLAVDHTLTFRSYRAISSSARSSS